MKHYTYWIIDHVNGMYYHGVHSSDDPENIRKYRGSCNALKEAIKLHGIENFSRRVERYHATRELANAWEIRVHRRLDVANNPRFYNAINARPFMCTKPGPLSEKHLRRLFSEEAKEKNAAKRRGVPRPKDDAWRKKVSEVKKGIPLTESHRKALTGVKKTLTDEQRETLRKNARGVADTGSSNHFNCKKLNGYVIWKIDNPKTKYFVLNNAAFAREIIVMTGSLSSKLQAIIRGERTEVKGYTVRLPSASETKRYKAILLESGLPYVKMGSV